MGEWNILLWINKKFSGLVHFHATFEKDVSFL